MQIGKPFSRAVWQGISEVLSVFTLSPRLFTSGNFVPRKLVGDISRVSLLVTAICCNNV